MSHLKLQICQPCLDLFIVIFPCQCANLELFSDQAMRSRNNAASAASAVGTLSIIHYSQRSQASFFLSFFLSHTQKLMLQKESGDVVNDAKMTLSPMQK